MSLGSLAIRTQTVEPVPLAPTRKRTLVVDDSETILHAICSLLEHHDVVEVAGRAESGTQAIDVVLELKPDLILMDADMPGMSGLELYDRLHEDDRLRRVPVIFETAVSREYAPEFRKRGIRKVLQKPFDLNELIADIKELAPPVAA